ncbi:DedA family protein [Nevskia sp.]|uniref:DedA family protein n=1 Tax=Nevskia sp. TaxID=1929292 RepID=UPI003F6F4CF0
MIEAFKQWIAEAVAQLGYGEILLLMALESSLFPVPSELVMIPAGYLARNGGLDPFLAALTGGFGSVLGASANYLLGRHVGRAFLLRFGKYLLINEAKYHEAEAMFLGNAARATFIGRFIPVVRHLISLPPGVFGMAYLPFALITFAGATIWCGVLVAAGYFFGDAAIGVISTYTHELTLAVLVLLVAGGLWFLLRRRG